jgi:hypothetical protein
LPFVEQGWREMLCAVITIIPQFPHLSWVVAVIIRNEARGHKLTTDQYILLVT